MLTKRHIKKYFNKLSASCGKNGKLSRSVWGAFHDYVVKHYHRLDQGARAFADEMFDELDSKVKDWIDGLPEGRKKRVLLRKFAMVLGERSPIPVIYLDTPVLEALIRHHSDQAGSGNNHTAAILLQRLQNLVGEAKVVCPEDVFHREVLQDGGFQANKGLDVIRTFSEGLTFSHGQTIEDSQVFRAIQHFIKGDQKIVYRKFWKDAFPKKTVRSIYHKRSTVTFQEAYLLGNGGDTGPPSASITEQTPSPMRLRIRYDTEAYAAEKRMQKNSARHLRELVRFAMRYQSVVENAAGTYLAGFWEGQKSDLALAVWSYLGGTPRSKEGMVTFFESELFHEIPSMKLKQDMWKACSADGRFSVKRETGAADLTVLSAVFPYTDVVVLGLQLARVVRDELGLGEQYDTEIYSLEDGERMLEALNQVAGAD